MCKNEKIVTLRDEPDENRWTAYLVWMALLRNYVYPGAQDTDCLTVCAKSQLILET